MRKSTIRKAFTLVEILIVVVILGILAAIVVPQFTSATQDSQAGNLRSQIGSLQRQVELFRAKNNIWPFPAAAGATNWNRLTGDEDGDGTANEVGEATYIKEAPRNPAWQGTGGPGAAAASTISVVAASTRGSATTGWVWELTNNRINASYFNETTGVVSATATD